MSPDQEQKSQNSNLNPEDYKFFLERIAHYLKVPYFWFFALITVILEITRLILDYIIIVGRLVFQLRSYGVIGVITGWYFYGLSVCF